MLSAHSVLRQYPSAQKMRNAGEQKSSLKEESLRTENGAASKDKSPIRTRDFQHKSGDLHHEQVTATTAIAARSLIDDPNPEFLDPNQRSIYISSRASSKNGARQSPSNPHSPLDSLETGSRSTTSSNGTYETQATSFNLPALQTNGPPNDSDKLQPFLEDDPRSFDLVAPPEELHTAFSLEARSMLLFSRDHLSMIFKHSPLLMRFTSFLSAHRSESVPVLIYYLDALKALKAISYSNAIAEALEPIAGYDFTTEPIAKTVNSALEEKAAQAFDQMVKDDLPAYITYVYIQVVSLSISRRITGTLAPHLREASEGLAEVFCLTDPSRRDNPIVFASEEFHRTTQYGVGYALGRNCRFLQGPKTNPLSVKRLKESVEAGKEHCEVFLNYRRDGSPFMNLLMIAPLCDSRGNIRYFIGAQVDVSGLVKECTDLESMQRLVVEQQNKLDNMRNGKSYPDNTAKVVDERDKKDEFRELSEMFNSTEIDIVKRYGGTIHRDRQDEDEERGSTTSGIHQPRLLLTDQSPDMKTMYRMNTPRAGNGKLSGVYQNYLLIRAFPSLRILFASPTLRVPGILQSPFMNKIGGSTRVREELTAALASGRGVTAKVRWVSRADEDGRNRWIHCTPLIGSNGQIGVWMVLIVDDETDLGRRWKQAPPVDPRFGRVYQANTDQRESRASSGDYYPDGAGGTVRGRPGVSRTSREGSLRSSSPYSFRPQEQH